MIGLILKGVRRSPTWHQTIVISQPVQFALKKVCRNREGKNYTTTMRMTCFLNWPSPIRKEKRRSLQQFHGRSSLGSYDRWRSFKIPASMLRFVLHTQIHGCLFGVWCSFDSVQHGAAVSLELGGRLHYTHVYIQMACKERENERVLYLPSQLGDDGATPSSSRPIGWRRRLSHIPPFALLLAPLLAAVYLASCCILLHIFVLICINIVPLSLSIL